MMSLDDWNAWQETLTLLSNPPMAQKLEQGMQEFDHHHHITAKTEKDLKSLEQ